VRNIYFWAAALWTVFITVCCLVSIKNFESVPVNDGYTDKYVHCTFYFIFTMLWFFYFRLIKPGDNRKQRLLVFLLAVVFGIIIEICQQLFTTDRSADITDVAANTTGSAIAILVLWLFSKRKSNMIPGH